jgi:hypothetical protein
MPDLKAILAPGPTLAFDGWRSSNGKMQLGLDLPIYLPVTVAASPRFLGPLFQPRLRFKLNDVAGVSKFDLLALVGPNFSGDQFNEYYYSVAARFATAERPAFEAQSGYSGSTLQLVLSRRTKKFYLTAAARYDNLSGATFADSPLVKRSNSMFIEFAVAYLFLKSERTIETND